MQSNAFARSLLFASIVVPAVVILFCFAFPHTVGRPWYVTIYFAPAIGGFVLWLYYRLHQTQRYGIRQALIDGTVVMLCSLRMTAPLVPMSGHMLFYVHAGITTAAQRFRYVIAALIIETSFIKLLVWGDYQSWLLGVLTGMASGWAYVSTRNHQDVSSAESTGLPEERRETPG